MLSRGTYSAEGITKLCEGLKGSAVTSLKCAAAPKCLLSCQWALTERRKYGCGVLERGYGASLEPLAQLGDALRGVGATPLVVEAAELVTGQAAKLGKSVSWGIDREAGATARRRESRLRRALSHGRTRDCAQRS